MPWTDTARHEYRREMDRYASDLTDREWELVAPFMPTPKRVGRPRKVDMREVVNALLYMAIRVVRCAAPMADAAEGFPAPPLDGTTVLLRLA